MPQVKFTYTKMNQDVSKTKFANDIYYEGRNIRILTNESFGSITNQKGNELILTIPNIDSNPTNKKHLDFIPYPIMDLNIVGHAELDNKLVLLSTGSNDIFTVHVVDEEYNIDLVYFDQIKVNGPLDVKAFYENENNQKIYFADGNHELRYLNISEDILDLDSNFISSVPDVNLSSPQIVGYINSGSHTSGMIQYAYNLYNLNGSQTKISSLSALYPLNNGDKGNDVNINVNKSPIIEVDNVDTNFEFIRLYSIKYISLNSTPEVKVLLDQPVSESIRFIDDNNSVIQNITYDEFIFLGGDVFIPKHINIKDNRLFLSNYKTLPFDIDFDTRAYSFNESGNTLLLDKDGNTLGFNISNIPNIDETHDVINPSIKAEENSEYYDLYKYGEGLEIGGIGNNVKYSIYYDTINTSLGEPDMTSNPNFADYETPQELKSLKQGEVYRLGLQFRNNKGVWSFAKWMADVKIPEIGMGPLPMKGTGIAPTGLRQINYANIRVQLINKPTDSEVTSWRIVIVERKESDKTIITQGFINPTIRDVYSPTFKLYPSYITRLFKNTAEIPNYLSPIPVVGGTQDNRNYAKPIRYNYDKTTFEYNLSSNVDTGSSESYRREILARQDAYILDNRFHCFYSPEIIKNKSNLSIGEGDRIRFLGFVNNTNTRSSRELYDTDGTLITTQKPQYATNTWSATETHFGDTLIFQLGFSEPNSNNANRDRIASFKFFGAQNHEGEDNNYLYTRRLQSFVRYFGGFEMINNNFSSRLMEINHNTTYLAPIEGVKTLILDSTTVDYDSNIKILTNFSDSTSSYANDYPAVIYKAFGGSCILLEIQNIEDRLPDLGSFAGSYLPIIEIVRNVENQYGGNTYEARQRNKYIPYSDTYSIDTDIIDGYMGDTYIQKFNFLKTFKSDVNKVTLTEIVSVPLESSINLDMRYDLLKDRPDYKEADELTSYGFNDVYNQNNNTISQSTKPSNFKEILNYPMDIIPSKLKISGELIDSFTDFLINDRKTLDGKYGEITGVEEYNDQLFAFQKNAIAYLAINPRVQINASDGIPIELGSGGIIERYQYVTTSSGTLNKWSIVKTKNGLMYFDLLNKSINFLADQEISTVNGLYNKIKDFTDSNYNNLKIDNPLIKRGVISHYDNNTEDIYFTFLSDNDSFTVAYNGLAQGFISYYDFIPEQYLSLNNKMITTDNSRLLYEHDKGQFQTFYGQYFPASITIIGNPEPERNKIFNNLLFHSECYVDGVDQPFTTINKLRIWNDYQDSTELNFSELTKRKFRNWAIQLPRNYNSRDRINNQWSFIKLIFDNNENNYRFILHDIVLGYL